MTVHNYVKIEGVRYSENRDVIIFKDVKVLPFGDSSLKVDRVSIIVCKEGSFNISLSDRSFEVLKNDIFICDINVVVTKCKQSSDCVCDIVSIDPFVLWRENSQESLWENYFSLQENPLINYSEDCFSKLSLYRDLLEIKFKEPDNSINREIIRFIIRSLVYDLLQILENQSNGYSIKILSRKEIIFRDFIDILRDMKVKERQVQWYADKLCITPKYLSLICKTVTGKTAIEWISEYVQRDINYLLKNSSKSIKEIADHLQFPNISFFGKYVKAYSKMSPREYRAYLKSQH